MTDGLDAARSALRQRQGGGARYDAPNAPAEDLALVRYGTAYFARKLNDLTDPDLSGASAVPNWSRRDLIACVAYQARGFCRLSEQARGAGTDGMYASAKERDAEIRRGASLPAHALRFLFTHSEVHLNVEWRDLPAAAWDMRVTPFDGLDRQMRDLPMERAKLIWLAAIDLQNGGRVSDIPEAVHRAIGPDNAGRTRSLGCMGLSA